MGHSMVFRPSGQIWIRCRGVHGQGDLSAGAGATSECFQIGLGFGFGFGFGKVSVASHNLVGSGKGEIQPRLRPLSSNAPSA